MAELTNFTPNSHKFKEEQRQKEERKKLDKVVTGKVVTKKKSGLTKFAEVFLPEDISSVRSYIFMDVLIPAGKKALSDIFDALLYGESRDRKPSSTSSKISYRKYFDSRDDRGNRDSIRTRSGYDYGVVVLETRGEAEEVLSRMDEILEEYGEVSVADMYDLVGITGEYTDNRYGWTNIRNANIVRVNGGYEIKMPKALPLQR